jgi:hypothetical protein
MGRISSGSCRVPLPHIACVAHGSVQWQRRASRARVAAALRITAVKEAEF